MIFSQRVNFLCAVALLWSAACGSSATTAPKASTADASGDVATTLDTAVPADVLATDTVAADADASGDVGPDPKLMNALFAGIREECRPKDLGCTKDAECTDGKSCVGSRCMAAVKTADYKFSPTAMSVGGFALPASGTETGQDFDGDGKPDNALAAALAGIPGLTDKANALLKSGSTSSALVIEFRDVPSNGCGPIEMVFHNATNDLDGDGIGDGTAFAVRQDSFGPNGPKNQFNTAAMDGANLATGNGLTFPLKFSLPDGREVNLPLEGVRITAIVPAGFKPGTPFLPYLDTAPAGNNAQATLSGFIRLSSYAAEVNRLGKECACAGVDISKPIAEVKVVNDEISAECSQAFDTSKCLESTNGLACRNLTPVCLAFGVMGNSADVATGSMVDSKGKALKDAVSMATYVTLDAAKFAQPPLAPEFGAVGDTYQTRADCDLDQNDKARPIPVVSNDYFDPAAKPIIAAVTQGNKGATVVVNPDGDKLLVTPATDYVGFETFTYTIQDAKGAKSTANVNIRVNPKKDFTPGMTVQTYCKNLCVQKQLCAAASVDPATCEAACVTENAPLWAAPGACPAARRELAACRSEQPCDKLAAHDAALAAAEAGKASLWKETCQPQIKQKVSSCGKCAQGTYGAACTPCPSNAQGICGGVATCSDGVSGDGTCTCAAPYTAFDAATLKCVSTNPCDAKPCAKVGGANADSCTPLGKSDWTCTCGGAAATWDQAGHQCLDACNPNPCTSLTNTTGVCVLAGAGFSCPCTSGYGWSAIDKVCLPTNTAPQVGTAIAFTGSEGAILKLSWGAATDDNTAPAALEYKLVHAKTNNLTTVANAEANGTLDLDWKAGATTATVTSGIEFKTTYYFAVLVRDSAGLKALYPVGTFTTPDSGSLVLGCVPGTTAVGVYGSSGAWLDGMGVRCAVVTGTTTGPSSDGPYIGGTSGNKFTFDCPSGSVLDHVKGANGNTNSAGWCATDTTLYQQFQCRNLSDGTLGTWSVKYGGGQPMNCGEVAAGLFDYSCPPGQSMIGISAMAVGSPGSFYVGFTKGLICY